MEKKQVGYKELSISSAIIFIIFLFFSDKEITDKDIQSKGELIYKSCETKIDGGKNKRYFVEFQFVNDMCTYSITRDDYKYFDLEKFQKEIQTNDTLVAQYTCDLIYHLSKKGGKEYTNLKEANNRRKKVFVWATVLAFMSCLYCFINAFFIRVAPEGLFWLVWGLIGLITHGILSLIFGNI